MTQLGESVAFGTSQPWKCPFPHRPKEHTETNYLPPPKNRNNSKVLSKKLNEASAHLTPIPISITVNSVTTPLIAQYSAHHLIPGNESWPKSKLYKWIDKSKKLVAGDVGYDVNIASNGIDLPSYSAVAGWRKKGKNFQKAYAFACIEADGKTRQFHDRHKAYSEFVIKVLNKIGCKFHINETPGCGKKNCGGSKEKPYDPPYELKDRLAAVAGRLEDYLWGHESGWRKPIMTSRFALMYKKRNSNMNQSEAREELNVENFR